MTRIAFCDDDAALLHQMQDFLEQYRTLRGVQLELFPYTKPMELLADIEAGVRFDVLFLDVLMPGINGINAAREIRRYDTAVQIIFVTSSSEFAVQSYVVGAYYYQLKPIWKDSFFRLTDAVLAECRKRTQHSLILRCKSGVTRITLDSLEYCEVQGRTLVFHLLDGTVIESSGSMDELARQLADYPGFLRSILRASRVERQRIQMEQLQTSLNLQVTQAMREIEALRLSQQRASTYRHDLRHHMQFLAGCIENGRTEQALGYIRSVCSEIEAGKVTAYCENEAANLIFSAFADRAAKAGVQFTVQAGISQALPVSESDLCVLLSNALENALHAAVRCREAGQGAFIETIGHEKGKKLFLQITNSCLPDVQFREGVPVTDRTGHGLGVRSICAISERYGGLTSFAAKDGQFTLRVML